MVGRPDTGFCFQIGLRRQPCMALHLYGRMPTFLHFRRTSNRPAVTCTINPAVALPSPASELCAASGSSCDARYAAATDRWHPSDDTGPSFLQPVAAPSVARPEMRQAAARRRFPPDSRPSNLQATASAFGSPKTRCRILPPSLQQIWTGRPRWAPPACHPPHPDCCAATFSDRSRYEGPASTSPSATPRHLPCLPSASPASVRNPRGPRIYRPRMSPS
jgi:hypothetical protein